MKYILTRKFLKPTARLLAKELGLVVRTEIVDDTFPTIRWGNSEGSSEDSPSNEETIYNSPELIYFASSKKAFSTMMLEGNITVIEFHKGTPEHYPVVVRTTLSGYGGKGIVVCENWEEFGQYDACWWSYWYNFSYELGVHILGGMVVKVFRKEWSPTDEMISLGISELKYPIRNSKKGYSFKLLSIEGHPKLYKTVEEFYKVFPIQMGRLDIGWDVNSKCYRVIEFNSAPGLAENDNTLKLYVDFLKEKLNG